MVLQSQEGPQSQAYFPIILKPRGFSQPMACKSAMPVSHLDDLGFDHSFVAGAFPSFHGHSVARTIRAAIAGKDGVSDLQVHFTSLSQGRPGEYHGEDQYQTDY